MASPHEPAARCADRMYEPIPMQGPKRRRRSRRSCRQFVVSPGLDKLAGLPRSRLAQPAPVECPHRGVVLAGAGELVDRCGGMLGHERA